MSVVRLVAEREIRVRLRTRSFQVTTVLLVLIAIGASILTAVFDDDEPDVRSLEVAVVRDGGLLLEHLQRVPSSALDLEVTQTDLDGASRLVSRGDVDVALVEGHTLLWFERVDLELESLLDALWVQADQIERGIAPPEPLRRQILDEADHDLDGITVGVAMAGVVGSFILIQTWGSLVAMGVVEEKSSRVIEVLLSHVTPRQLIAGKVIGLGLLAMTQAVIAVLGLVGALLVTDSVDIPSTTWRAVAFLLLTIGGGFAFYAVVFAAAGSLVSRTEDAQQVIIPVALPLLIGYFLGVSSIDSPDTPLAIALSFIPFTIPTGMPLRLAGGGMALWEVALAFGILVGSTVLMARFAGRLYHVSLLHAGARIRWRDALSIARGR